MTPFWQASVTDQSIAPPQIVEADGSPTWVARGTNFVIAITRARAGLRLRGEAVPDEHMVLLPGPGATLRTEGAVRDVPGYHLAILPPGDSEIVAAGDGLIVRCFSRRHGAMLALAGNAADFATLHEAVAPLQDTVPPGGSTLRVYDLAAALSAGDKNRCYRSGSLMLNVLREREVPRDLGTLSPHSHDHFEQGSIALSGTFIHHLRTPWGPDGGLWQPDRAVQVGSPSVTVIAPQVVHTTRNIGSETGFLVDLFCPPRADFLLRPGMVRNADDYLLPGTAGSLGNS